MNHQTTFLKDYCPSDFLIASANLEFQLDPKETIVKSILTIKRNPLAQTTNSFIVLDGKNLELLEIKLNQQTLSNKQYQVSPQSLTINQVPDEFSLEITAKIIPEKNFTCTGLYLTNGNFCTQNEPHGFRTITYFIDRPDILTKFTTKIIANKNDYPVLLSNGNLIQEEQNQDGTHTSTWQDPFPKSAYLFALVAGKFSAIEDSYTTQSNRQIKLKIFADEKNIAQCQHAMCSLKQAMAWDEENFGLEYDLDIYQIVAINDLNFGAMENKSLNVFNSKLLLASPDTATDSDFIRVASVIAHEYFHNWTGNRVTCRDWFQIGLKEGLTTLREQLFTEDHYGYATSRIESIKTLYNEQFPEDSGPLAHPIRLPSYIEVDNFYTRTVYNKSAEVARMLITLFDREVFRKILTSFLKKYDGKPTTIEELIQTASDIAGINLEQFKLWYDQAGTPVLKVTDAIDNQNIYTIKIEQSHPQAQKDFYLPLNIGLIDDAGKNFYSQTLVINQHEQTFNLPHIGKKPTLALLQNFSAPAKIEYHYNLSELLHIASHSQDSIIRWEAAQKLAIATILDSYNQNKLSKHFVTLRLLFKQILENNDLDPGLAAKILALPSEQQLLELLSAANVTKLHDSRQLIKLTLANDLADMFADCYHNIQLKLPYSLDSNSINTRALKNLALDYLVTTSNPKAFELATEQLKTADNLTNTFCALIALANSSYTQKEELLQDYYQRWHQHPNLLNKWFLINATIQLPGNLALVQKLLQNPAFNLKNPNNVYSVIRAFAENNLANFHAPDGSGYKFLADQVLKIDKFNSQLAAMIATPLGSGKNLDHGRQQLLQKELTRIYSEPNISSNLYEIVTKSISEKRTVYE